MVPSSDARRDGESVDGRLLGLDASRDQIDTLDVSDRTGQMEDIAVSVGVQGDVTVCSVYEDEAL